MKAILKIFTIFTDAQKRECVLLIIWMIIGAILEAIGISLIFPFLSFMGDGDFFFKHELIKNIVAFFNITTHIELIMAGIYSLIIIYAIKNLYLIWQSKKQINFALNNQVDFSIQLLAEYLAKPYIFHLNHNTAMLFRNVNDIGIVIFSNTLIPLFNLLTEVITVIGIWLMLAMIDIFTAIVAVGFIGAVLYAILKTFHSRVEKYGQIQNAYRVKYGKWINQSLGAIKETKVSGKENYFLSEFSRDYEKYGNAHRKFIFTNQLPRPIIEFTVVTGLLTLIVFKIVVIGEQPTEIVPLLGVLSLAAFRLMPSAYRIISFYNGIKFQLPLFEEIYDELIAIRDRKEKKIGVLSLEKINKMPVFYEIRINHLGFQYPEGKADVLKDVSFAIPKGAFVGIVGSSGAGKTTFVDILLGLLKPNHGNITADGIDIQTDIRAWQANLAYVPQDIYLIDGTVRENIALGLAVDNIDEMRLIKILKMAELYDFVENLPKGLDTMVGERGVKLSGGQRQRIGIARSLYYQPKVLIFDEATSSLDSETEKSITDTILKLKGKITIIAIAHRITTLDKCDFKIKFENGLAEQIY